MMLGVNPRGLAGKAFKAQRRVRSSSSSSPSPNFPPQLKQIPTHLLLQYKHKTMELRIEFSRDRMGDRINTLIGFLPTKRGLRICSEHGLTGIWHAITARPCRSWKASRNPSSTSGTIRYRITTGITKTLCLPYHSGPPTFSKHGGTSITRRNCAPGRTCADCTTCLQALLIAIVPTSIANYATSKGEFPKPTPELASLFLKCSAKEHGTIGTKTTIFGGCHRLRMKRAILVLRMYKELEYGS